MHCREAAVAVSPPPSYLEKFISALQKRSRPGERSRRKRKDHVRQYGSVRQQERLHAEHHTLTAEILQQRQ